MDRSIKGYTASSDRAARTAARFGLLISTAVASVALASCTAAAPPAETSFAKAQAAMDAGKGDSAIAHAEEAVLADPRNAGYRALLGATYLDAGRFASAAQAFGDALDLGHNDPRTVLSYALAKVAIGDNKAAIAKLAEYERAIPSADYGLALALAGQPERGVHHLINNIRHGEASPKSRQNLAYAYALAGNWRAARVMAAEDVPADQLDARLSDWASLARPEDFQARVANLLGVTPAADSGQPQYLALANFPSQPAMVAEAAVQADAAPLPVAAPTPAPALAEAKPRQSEAMAFGLRDIDTAMPETAQPTAQPAVAAGPRFVSNAVVQKLPASTRAAPAPAPTRVAAAPVRTPTPAPVRAAQPAPQQARMAVATGSADTHLVQLGSFDSREIAQAKWNEFQKRFPDLKGRDVVITEALVNGRTYFRLAAAGFGARSASSMCAAVKGAGRGCFAYAASSPPAGAVANGVRVAAR